MSRTQMFEALEQRKLLTAYMGTDPCDPMKTALFVDGAETIDDEIVVSKVGSSGDVEVSTNGDPEGIFAPTGRIIVHGLGGDDDIEVASNILLTAQLDGGSGNDTLKGGGGNDVIFGRAGDDKLSGRGGRDFLVGGHGADKISGNGGDDLLLAMRWIHEDYDPAICEVMSIWTDPLTPYHLRVGQLDAGDGGWLYQSTRDNDLEPDTLIGGTGRDAFWLSQVNNETIVDLSDDEFATT